MARKAVTQEELEAALAELPGWEVKGEKLHKAFKFGSFAEALGCMGSVQTVPFISLIPWEKPSIPHTWYTTITVEIIYSFKQAPFNRTFKINLWPWCLPGTASSF